MEKVSDYQLRGGNPYAWDWRDQASFERERRDLRSRGGGPDEIKAWKEGWRNKQIARKQNYEEYERRYGKTAIQNYKGRHSDPNEPESWYTWSEGGANGKHVPGESDSYEAGRHHKASYGGLTDRDAPLPSRGVNWSERQASQRQAREANQAARMKVREEKMSQRRSESEESRMKRFAGERFAGA